LGTRKKVNSKVKRFHVVNIKAPRRKAPPVVDYAKQEEMARAERFQKRTQEYLDKGLHTVGVRFASDPAKVYTYLVPSNLEHYLGQEVVVENERGLSRVAYLVRIDDDVKLPDPNEYDAELKRVRGTVVPYAQ
jgi:hypothetical protein